MCQPNYQSKSKKTQVIIYIILNRMRCDRLTITTIERFAALYGHKFGHLFIHNGGLLLDHPSENIVKAYIYDLMMIFP